MTCRPSLERVHNAIDERLDSPRLALRDLAEALACSESTVKRACAPDTFSSVLLARRADRAVKEILGGATVRQAAAATGVSPDHLTRLFYEVFGVRPGEFRAAVEGAAAVTRWQARLLPTPGSRLYHSQRTRWKRIEALVASLVVAATPGTEAEAWLRSTAETIERPDYRWRSHRKYGARGRRRHQEVRLEMVAAWAMRDFDMASNPFRPASYWGETP